MPDQASDSSQEHLYEEQHALSSPAGTSMAPRQDDPERRLDTLIAAVGEDLAQAFFWKADTGSIQTYEHRFSYRYVHIDRVTGTFFDQERTPISLEQALAHAMPRLQSAPSQWALAPMILEPDLAPFVRVTAAGQDDQRVRAPGEQRSLEQTSGQQRSGDTGWLTGLISRSYGQLLLKFQTIGRFAKGAATPMGEDAEAAQDHLQGSDLSLASFTRRAA